jgi:hypothetical protein
MLPSWYRSILGTACSGHQPFAPSGDVVSRTHVTAYPTLKDLLLGDGPRFELRVPPRWHRRRRVGQE